MHETHQNSLNRYLTLIVHILFFTTLTTDGGIFLPRREIIYLKNATTDFNDFFFNPMFKRLMLSKIKVLKRYHRSVTLKFKVTHFFKAVFT